MTKYVTNKDQNWETTDVRGAKVEKCLLWEGKYNVRSGFFRMPKGLEIPAHHHAYWVQILVLSGKMQVEAVGSKAQTIEAGEYYGSTGAGVVASPSGSVASVASERF